MSWLKSFWWALCVCEGNFRTEEAAPIVQGFRLRQLLTSTSLRVDSPFFPTIVLFENRPFPRVSGVFLERRIPGKNGHGR